MNIRITTLIENSPSNKEALYYEHGLSFLIEADDKTILFDTGQSGDFYKNARVLHKDLNKIDYVFLSHGHYDHTGGVKTLLKEIKKRPQFIVGEEFFLLKYKRLIDNKYKFNGNSFDEEYLKDNDVPMIKIENGLHYLTKNIIVFHGFQRKTEFETLNNHFYIKEGSKYIQDDFNDEIALGIRTEKGLVVIVGCSHVGIINILTSITDKINIPIYAVIGGTHLVEADEMRMEQTLKAFMKLNIQMIAVSHCTGQEAIKYLQMNLENTFILNDTGHVIEV